MVYILPGKNPKRIDEDLIKMHMDILLGSLDIPGNTSDLKSRLRSLVTDERSYAEHKLFGNMISEIPKKKEKYWTPYGVMSGYYDIEEANQIRQEKSYSLDYVTSIPSLMGIDVLSDVYVSLGLLGSSGSAEKPVAIKAFDLGGNEIDVSDSKYCGEF